jgi:hypothetical protein
MPLNAALLTRGRRRVLGSSRVFALMQVSLERRGWPESMVERTIACAVARAGRILKSPCLELHLSLFPRVSSSLNGTKIDLQNPNPLWTLLDFI